MQGGQCANRNTDARDAEHAPFEPFLAGQQRDRRQRDRHLQRRGRLRPAMVDVHLRIAQLVPFLRFPFDLLGGRLDLDDVAGDGLAGPLQVGARQLDVDQLRRLCAGEGLVCAVRAGTQHGWLVLWDIADASVDFLDLGPELGRAAGAVLDRDALLSAMEQGTAVRTRLSLARDVHDSVVQFLAGAAFRVEAVIRNAKASAPVEPDLAELKRLLIEEQVEIRLFVSALRRERELEFTEAVDELKALAGRLARQWSVRCRVRSTGDEASIPIRLQLDLQHLLREAVANAVRHGGADKVEVRLSVEEGRLRLEITDNGTGFAASGEPGAVEPWSLKERVERAHGSLSLLSRPGATKLVITLPLIGAVA